MRYFYAVAILLASCGLVFGQSKAAQWQRMENNDEVLGPQIGFMLRAAEPPVNISVLCEGENPVMARIEFGIPLQVEATDSAGRPTTELIYRVNNQVATFSARISSDGSTVYSSRMTTDGITFYSPAVAARQFQRFVGKAVLVEDIFGHMHMFHFPAASLTPFEDGACK